MATKIQKIQKIGNSAGILIPKEWLKELGFKVGEKVRCKIADARIIIMQAKSEKEKTVKVNAKFAKMVEEFIDENEELLGRLD